MITKGRDEGPAARKEHASPIGDYHLCLIGDGIGDSVATHVPSHTCRRFSFDARDIDTQIADGICHGERLTAIELLSSRV